MLRTLTKVSEAQTLVVSQEDMKAHLGIIDNWDLTRITEYLYAAQDVVARECQLSFVTTTWLEQYDQFPLRQPIETAKAGVQSITSLKYYDFQNTLQTLVLGTDFTVVLPTEGFAVLYPFNAVASPYEWQMTYRYRPDCVQLTYVCGPLTIPMVGHCIKILVTHWFDGNRGSNESDWPPGLERMFRLVRPAVYQ